MEHKIMMGYSYWGSTEFYDRRNPMNTYVKFQGCTTGVGKYVRSKHTTKGSAVEQHNGNGPSECESKGTIAAYQD